MIKEEIKVKAGWNFNNSYIRLPELFFNTLNPTSVTSPELLILNQDLAEALSLNVKALQSEEGVAVFAGNMLPEGATPISQAYAGHQFGHFTMLGDGRALLLGEQITTFGERFDIQLKGSGRTPYSRNGDGRAHLSAMLREFIISEAMYSLGIPTTRSLAVVTTGEEVMRETWLPGAILTRIASSHLRVGTFQYAANWGTKEELKTLADYTIERHFPEIEDKDAKYLTLLQKVIKLQAELIAKWQLVGFIHGVMNTDNMSISGETIDYGPCAFMNSYDPATVFSSIDKRGRYAYGNQPAMAQWNLARFADTLLPLLQDNQEEAIKLAEGAISNFSTLYHHNWLVGMRAKLGIFNEEREDDALVKDLLSIMEKEELDYTNTFLALTFDQLEDINICDERRFNQWYNRWKDRLDRQTESKEDSQRLMRHNNPAVIPRNHRVEEVLKSAVEDRDYSLMEEFLDVLTNPYAHSPEQTEYAKPPEPSDTPYHTFCGT